MSSPARLPHHRRRSHSASSPIRGTHYSDGSDLEQWRPSIKRARPSSTRSSSYRDFAPDELPEKWDVDQWRRGKRARRDAVSHRGARSPQHAQNPPHTSSWDANSSTGPSLGLPSTSAAFQLFPRERKARRASAQLSSPRRDVPARKSGRHRAEDLDQLRSNAFWELQQSVAESGEGLVNRMRDWEDSRSRSCMDVDHSADLPLRRSTRQNYDFGSEAAISPDTEEEDVEIVSCDVTQDTSFFEARSSPQKKRAYSLGTMDLDFPEYDASVPQPFTLVDSSECCSSPPAISSGISACSSDDEELDAAGPLLGPSCTPALSHTDTNSTNSSLVSLPLAAHDASHASPFSRFSFSMPPTSLKSFQVPSTASRTEKALAALTLAMANGAGGLNDYEALRSAEGSLADAETCDAGEMWH